MNRCCWLLPTLLLPWAMLGFDAGAQDKKPGQPVKISWKKFVLDKTFRSEGVAVADVNKDGKPDVIVGDCWYEAPQDPAGAWKRHVLRADRAFDPHNYSDAFCCFADDFDGDGNPDVIVIPFPGNPCYWYQNPGSAGGKWKQHLVTNSACNETPIYVDLFKTGKKILVMGWNPSKDEKDLKKGNYDDRGEVCYFLPGKDPTQPWQRVSISGPSAKGKTIPGTARFAHGLGHGDLNGDGRIDVIVPQGWWEQPSQLDGTPWKFHAAKISDACADMYAIDIDGDGKADVVSTSAHNYGFWWSQQKDLNTFLQRPLFLPPGDLTKLPKDVTLNADEKALVDGFNKLRASQRKQAPLAVHAELCRMASDHARRSLAKDDAKVSVLADKYSGKIHATASEHFAKGSSKNPVEELIKLIDKGTIPPGYEIGVGTAKNENGDLRVTVILGDRGLFSLPAQTHALHHVDIDGDGLKDLVTGRRWWAHGPKGDANPGDPAYLYWFKARRDKEGVLTFTPHVIDDESGVGTQFAIADLNGDGIPDIVISNKRGVFVFLQIRTPAVDSAPPRKE